MIDLFIIEACIGVLGIQDICHFTSRDIGYFPFYFQGYGILCSISGMDTAIFIIYFGPWISPSQNKYGYSILFLDIRKCCW